MTSESASEKLSRSRTDQEGTFTIVATSESGLQFTLKRSNHNSKKLSEMKGNNEEAESDGEVIEGSVSSKTENSDDDVSSSPIPICPECPRIFPSMKSLYGHLRSHPNKGYRGTIRPRISLKRAHAQLKQEASIAKRATAVTSCWGTRARRGRTELEAIYDAAEILMSMHMSNNISVPEPAKTYRCTTCDKAFATHQALGGHRASHNKLRNVSSAEALAEHRCKTCNETFATGQALGGHMRRHFTGYPSTVCAITLDLNEVPKLEEEGEI